MQAVSPGTENKTKAASKEAGAGLWWRGAVIYQIYPRSFRDTTGNGVGDLRGILGGLDYVADLGVDGVWLSPFFASPMADYGYDVSDYRAVDPLFGTLEDFDAIVEKAHRLGLKVIIDQVYSHTSDQHAWFKASRASRDGPHSDWYVWADPKADGAPPSNWQSVFGGPAWSWDARRKQYYMHNFLREQPQLNVGLGAVQDALLDVARFWLERGVDGFRLDAINFAIHNPELTDNPPSGAPMETVTRPFDMQRHVHNQSQPAIPAFLERIRAVMDEYGAVFSVAEVGGPAPLDEMKAFTAGTRRLHSAYSFDFLYADTLTPEGVRAALSNWSDAPGEGWPSWAFSNHDAPRAVSRWAGGHGTEQVSKLLLLLLLSLRGNPFVYQGEELGLPQSAVAFEHLKDPEALANWPHTLGRDGARTPFPWATQAASAGFSSSAETWLPMDTGHAAHAVDRQAQHPSSCLNVTRALLAIRNAAPALRCGTLEFLKTPETVLAYIRQVEGEQVLCAFNLGDEAASWEPASPWAQSGELIASQDGPAAGPLPRSLPARAGYWAKLGPGE